MTKRQHIRSATRGTIPYLAGEYLHKAGPQTKEALFAAVSFGAQAYKRQDALDRAIQSSWLMETSDGKIACGADARRYYSSLAPEGDQPTAEPTAPAYRGNVFGKPLDPKRIPNRRGLRPANDAAPAWSVREKLSIKTIGGGAE